MTRVLLYGLHLLLDIADLDTGRSRISQELPGSVPTALSRSPVAMTASELPMRGSSLFLSAPSAQSLSSPTSCQVYQILPVSTHLSTGCSKSAELQNSPPPIGQVHSASNFFASGRSSHGSRPSRAPVMVSDGRNAWVAMLGSQCLCSSDCSSVSSALLFSTHRLFHRRRKEDLLVAS